MVFKITPDGVLTVWLGTASPVRGRRWPGHGRDAEHPGRPGCGRRGQPLHRRRRSDRVRRVTPDGIITTFAGGGSSLNDNVAATSALLVSPSGIAFDTAGNLYIAEQGQHRIRKVSANWRHQHSGGNARQGFAGDGGPATSANLNGPASIAIDPTGAMFIADTGNNRIRRVNLISGTITTIAGGATAGFSGDGGRPRQRCSTGPPAGVFDPSATIFCGEQERAHPRDRRRPHDYDRGRRRLAGLLRRCGPAAAPR